MNEFVVVGIRVSVGVLAVVCAFGDMWLRVWVKDTLNAVMVQAVG